MRLDLSRSPRDPLWVEIASGTGLMAWGAYVHLMSVPLGDLPAYDTLDGVPEWFWAALTVGCGAVQVAATLGHRRILRWSAALGACVLWKVLTVSLAKSGQPAPAEAVYCVLAFANVPTIVFLRPRPRLIRR